MKTIRLLDNSRIKGYRECPLYFYMSYVRHWSPTKIRPPLLFGSSWHAAKEAILLYYKSGRKNQQEVIELAIHAFNKEWQKEAPLELSLEQVSDVFKARIPGTGHEIIHNYVEQHAHELEQIEILAVEKPFAVPMYSTDDIDIYIAGRLDSIIRDSDGIWIGDDKTTSMWGKKHGFQRKWQRGWSTNSQVDTYTYAGKMMYGQTEMRGLYINGICVNANVHDQFCQLPIMKGMQDLERWYNDTVHWIDRILWSEKNQCWPHNVAHCQNQFGDCQYLDLCEMTYNPEQIPDAPLGFEVKKWEPFDEQEFTKMIQQEGMKDA